MRSGLTAKTPTAETLSLYRSIGSLRYNLTSGAGDLTWVVSEKGGVMSRCEQGQRQEILEYLYEC